MIKPIDLKYTDFSENAGLLLILYLTSLQLVLCRVAAENVSPYINHSAVYILFWSFEISDNILRNQK